MTTEITPEVDALARAMAKASEPDLDWDNPSEFDLLDRTVITESATKILARLKWAGFTLSHMDDLCLDEFDVPSASERDRA